MENETDGCDICYDDEQILLEINCCKGKKWCNCCKLKVLKINDPTCPFCRTLLQSTLPINCTKTPPNSRVHSLASSPSINGKMIYIYSLTPNNYQPSGSINYSRIDSGLLITFESGRFF